MTTERNFTNVGRSENVAPQNIQHFMSNSPWSAQAVFKQVQSEIAATPSLRSGGMLLLDESAEEKASGKSAGAGRQYNGRFGVIDMSQVGTFLAYANGGTWTWVDGELFIPEHWFTDAMADERARVGIAEETVFAKKVELGWRMIQRVREHGLPFEAIGCDTFYGRSTWFRRTLNTAGLVYMADVPASTNVYLERPDVGVPTPTPGSKGRVHSKARVLSTRKAVEVRQIPAREDTCFQRIIVRSTERGELDEEFSIRRVWTQQQSEEPVEEWLVIRHEAGRKYTYALSNAPADTAIDRLARLKSQRYFIERANQDAKSEIGWNELRAQKCRAWEHHLALTILASWFIAQTKLEWAESYERDPALKKHFEVEVLPALSTANVRELLRAVMPLPQLTPQEAASLVVEHLVNRTRARKSRLKNRSQGRAAP